MAKLPEGRSTLTDEQMIGLTHRLVDTCIDCKGRIEELEGKLAKAVVAVQEAIRLADQPHYGDRGDALDHCFNAIDVLRTTLTELTGGKDE